MKEPNSSSNKRTAIGLLISIGITTLSVGMNNLRDSYPLLTWFLPSILIVVGLLLLLGGLIVYSRYSQVYDFEATVFLGKQGNGKEVRGTLMTIEIIGGWCVILGFIIFALFSKP